MPALTRNDEVVALARAVSDLADCLLAAGLLPSDVAGLDTVRTMVALADRGGFTDLPPAPRPGPGLLPPIPTDARQNEPGYVPPPPRTKAHWLP
jgi:hypothetical protein